MEGRKKKQSWKLISIALSPLLLLVLGLFCCRSSLSFHINEIRPSRDFPFQSVSTVSKEEYEKLQWIFSRPFLFLEEEEQCYSFQSQDYVIKFFKMKRLTPKYWLNYIPFPWLEKLRLSKIGERERTRQETFGSFTMAFEEFRVQTGLLFIHLFRTEWIKARVQVKDQQGFPHIISLDSVPFILQKKAKTLSEYMESLARQNRKQEILSSFLLILDLVRDGCQHGLALQDSGYIERDYGFIGTQAVCINPGHMIRDESLKNSLNALREVLKVSKRVEIWLGGHHPDLVKPFQKEVQDLLSLLEEDN
jgi:hypothetical protein